MSYANKKRNFVFQEDDAPSKRYKTPTYTKKRAKVPQPTRTAIQRAIMASRETKEVITRTLETSLGTIMANNMAVYSFPVPAIGSSTIGRIGNEINPISLGCKYLLHNNSSFTCFVRVLVVRVRQGYGILNTNIDDSFFEGPGGQDVATDGTLRDLMAEPDRGEYHVMYDRLHTLGYDAAGYSSPNSRVAIANVKLKPLKNMKFEDNVFEQPIADRYVLCVLARRSDSDEAAGELLEMSHDLSMRYKD